MRLLALIATQVRYNFLAFVRNPASAFFTLVFPLMFLVIFNVVFGSGKTVIQGRAVSMSDFYVPGITVFGVISACYTNVAMSVATRRESGLLKRVRGTPVPTWLYLGALMLNAVAIALILVVIFLAFGRVFFDVATPASTLPAFIVSVLMGAAAFCALGLAVSTFVPNEDAAPAIVNATVFPLLFISDVFISSSAAPAWLNQVADFFPIKHFSDALQTAFSPFTTGSGFRGNDLLVIAAWGAAALLFAVWRFSWEPHT